MLPAHIARRVFLAAAFSSASSATRGQTAIPVVASFSILADLVRQVGGARVAVTSLIGPDQDAHAYQPRPSDARAIAAAQVMVINGLGYEGWAERLALSADFRNVPVVASRGIKVLRAGHSLNRPDVDRKNGHRHSGHSHDTNAVDPHAWQDVANVKIYVQNIRAGLAKADPSNAARYAAAAQLYLEQLDKLDTEIRAAWAAIPRDRRRIVTSHDAFAYYGDAYGVDFFAPQVTGSSNDPTPRVLLALISQIRDANIRALFVENIANPQMLQQVARETGARIGPRVYSDALTGNAGPAATYVDLMRHNTQNFIAAVQ